MCALSARNELAVLNDMNVKEGPTEQNDARREGRCNSRVSAFLHDRVNNGYRQTSEDRREGPHSNIGNVRLRVIVANTIKRELAVESNKPTREAEQHLRQWRMYIEVVLPLDVVSCKLAEVHLVKAEGGVSSADTSV